MTELKLRRWDVVNHLKSDEELVLYLEAALEDGLPELIAAALVSIARAKGLLVTKGEVTRGESYLEKAIAGGIAVMAEIKLKLWDVIEHWPDDEDILLYLQVALEDGMPELIAAALVSIARAKGLLVTKGEVTRGESYLEKAIADAYARYSDAVPDVITLPAPVAEGAS